ncbi:MAG: hypothetical protein WD872_10165 [Pirellulaceae bacterium]
MASAIPLLAAPPKLNYLFPAGGQRGQTTAVTAAGEFANWPAQVWADRPGLTATCEADKGKLQIAVAADAAAGTYWLRLADAEGASSLRPFVVGILPEVAENEPNDTPDKPQVVSPGVVVNGKLQKGGDLDGFTVELQEGQTLVAAVQAHSILGSPLDSVLQVCELVERRNSGSQRVIVEAYPIEQNHDAIGLDPQIVFAAPQAGRYLVRLFAFPSEPNSTIGFAGGETFVYRLTMTTGGYLDHVLPLALPREAAAVRLAGWNLPEGATSIEVSALVASDDPLQPPDGALDWVFHPEAAGAASVNRCDGAAIDASEASSPKAPQAVALPIVVSGRFEAADDADAFSFAGKKDQKVRLTALAHGLGFLTDPHVSVLGEDGKVVGEADDTGRDQHDPELVVTLPADGTYRAVIRDLHGRSGLRLVYRLAIETPTPDFSVSLAADSFVLAADKPLEIPLTVAGTDGFKGPVEIRAIGLPAGVSADPLTIEPKAAGEAERGSGRRKGRRGGNSAAASSNAKLVLKADPATLQPGGGPIRIEVRYKNEAGDEIVRSARFDLGQPLAGKHWAAWLTIKK